MSDFPKPQQNQKSSFKMSSLTPTPSSIVAALRERMYSNPDLYDPEDLPPEKYTILDDPSGPSSTDKLSRGYNNASGYYSKAVEAIPSLSELSTLQRFHSAQLVAEHAPQERRMSYSVPPDSFDPTGEIDKEHYFDWLRKLPTIPQLKHAARAAADMKAAKMRDNPQVGEEVGNVLASMLQKAGSHFAPLGDIAMADSATQGMEVADGIMEPTDAQTDGESSRDKKHDLEVPVDGFVPIVEGLPDGPGAGAGEETTGDSEYVQELPLGDIKSSRRELKSAPSTSRSLGSRGQIRSRSRVSFTEGMTPSRVGLGSRGSGSAVMAHDLGDTDAGAQKSEAEEPEAFLSTPTLPLPPVTPPPGAAPPSTALPTPPVAEVPAAALAISGSAVLAGALPPPSVPAPGGFLSPADHRPPRSGSRVPHVVYPISSMHRCKSPAGTPFTLHAFRHSWSPKISSETAYVEVAKEIALDLPESESYAQFALDRMKLMEKTVEAFPSPNVTWVSLVCEIFDRLPVPNIPVFATLLTTLKRELLDAIYAPSEFDLDNDGPARRLPYFAQLASEKDLSKSLTAEVLELRKELGKTRLDLSTAKLQLKKLQDEMGVNKGKFVHRMRAKFELRSTFLAWRCLVLTKNLSERNTTIHSLDKDVELLEHRTETLKSQIVDVRRDWLQESTERERLQKLVRSKDVMIHNVQEELNNERTDNQRLQNKIILVENRGKQLERLLPAGVARMLKDTYSDGGGSSPGSPAQSHHSDMGGKTMRSGRRSHETTLGPDGKPIKSKKGKKSRRGKREKHSGDDDGDSASGEEESVYETDPVTGQKIKVKRKKKKGKGKRKDGRSKKHKKGSKHKKKKKGRGKDGGDASSESESESEESGESDVEAVGDTEEKTKKKKEKKERKEKKEKKKERELREGAADVDSQDDDDSSESSEEEDVVGRAKKSKKHKKKKHESRRKGKKDSKKKGGRRRRAEDSASDDDVARKRGGGGNKGSSTAVGVGGEKGDRGRGGGRRDRSATGLLGAEASDRGEDGVVAGSPSRQRRRTDTDGRDHSGAGKGKGRRRTRTMDTMSGSGSEDSWSTNRSDRRGKRGRSRKRRSQSDSSDSSSSYSSSSSSYSDSSDSDSSSDGTTSKRGVSKKGAKSRASRLLRLVATTGGSLRSTSNRRSAARIKAARGRVEGDGNVRTIGGKKGRKRVVLTADQAKGLTKKERFKLEMELSGSVGRGARRGSDGEIDVLEDEGGGRRGKKPQARSLQRRHSFSRMDDAAKEGEEFLFNALQEDTPPPGSVMCPNCGQTFRPTANHSGGIDLNSSMKQKLLGIPPNVLSRLTLGVPSTGQPSVSGTTGRSGTSGASGTSKAAAPRKPKDRMPFAWKKFLKNAKGQPPMSQKQFFDMTSGLFKARLEVSLQLDKEKDDAKLAMVENMQEYVCMYLQMKYGLKNIAEMQLAKMAVYLMAAKDRDEPRAIILARFCGMYSDESFLGQDAVDLFVRLLDAVSKQIGHRFWVMFADAFKRPIFVSREWLIDYCLHSFPPQSSAKNLGKKLAKALETTLAEAINLEAFLLQAMTLLVEAQANVTRFLQDAFRSLDDGDGVLDKDEFVSLIQHVAPSYNIMEAGKLFTECKKIENAITEHAFIVFVFNKRLGISLPDEYIVEDDIDDEGDIHLDLPPSPSLTPVPEGITAENGGETNAPGVSQTSPSGNEVPIGSMQALSGSFSLGTGGFALRQSEAEHNNPPDNSGDEVTGSADGADDLSASCQGTAREGAPSNADTVGNLEPSHDDTRPGSRDGTQHSLGSPLSPGHRGLPRTSSVGSVGNLSLSNGVEAEGSNEERSLSRQAPLPLSQLGQDGQQFPEPGGATSSDSSSGGG
eukprot:Rmarinus@m.28882